MMTPEERRYAENRAVNMSRLLRFAASACAVFLGFVGLGTLIVFFVFAVQGIDAPSMWINGVEVKGVHSTLFLLVTSVASLALAYSCRCAKRLCENVERCGTPFILDNVRQLERIGFCIIGAAAAYSLGLYALDLAFGTRLSNLPDLLWVWAGIIIVFLARVFEYGCALQEQDDELL